MDRSKPEYSGHPACHVAAPCYNLAAAAVVQDSMGSGLHPSQQRGPVGLHEDKSIVGGVVVGAIFPLVASSLDPKATRSAVIVTAATDLNR